MEADLELARRCSARDDAAVKTVWDKYHARLASMLRRRGFADVCDEIMQRVFEKAFAADRPAIAMYDGRGSLGQWLETVAMRAALNLRRSRRREVIAEVDTLLERSAESDDPELAPLKARYRKQFKTAFQHAFGDLAPRERNLIRYEYLDGLNLEALAAVYGVHRATVARWRARARARLLAATRRAFVAKNEVTRSELDSILRLIESQLSVSASRVMREHEEGTLPK